MAKKARCPKHSEIAPFDIAVEFVEVVGEEGDFGEYDHDKRLIRIQQGQTPAEERDTVWHEHLHALLRACGVSDLFLGGDMEAEERLVSVLTPHLLALLRRNPALVAYLMAK